MIAHIDMDAFFAKCEELRNPELKEKPVVICVYTRGKTSGAVSTSNYRARELGIGSAMPLSVAREKASQDTVFLPVDHEYYRRKSEQVMSIIRSYSPKIQKTSIDEAYFRLEENPVRKANRIKERIEKMGLTASIGLAPNKFLAKMASEEDKPDGLKKLEERQVQDFLSGRSVDELHGIGDKTAQKLEEMNIQTVDDLREANGSRLVVEFGQSKTASLKSRAEGRGSNKIEVEEQKQISKIKTMERNSSDPDYVIKELEMVADLLMQRIEKKQKAFQKVGLVAIDSELNTYTRYRTVKTSKSREELLHSAEKLLRDLIAAETPEVRRIGIRVGKLVDRKSQTDLKQFRD